MDTGWIQVFVLTLAECVAPPGKSVCQEQEFDLVFLEQADCLAALEQLVTLKQESANVIVNLARSGCAPTARQSEVFTSLEEINAAHENSIGWRQPVPGQELPGTARAAHSERLSELKTCDETRGIAPCKIGEIIIEGANGDPVDLWRRN